MNLRFSLSIPRSCTHDSRCHSLSMERNATRLPAFVDVCRRFSMFVDVCRHLSTFFDVCRHLSMFVDACRRLSMFVDVFRCLSTFVDTYRRLSMFVDACRNLIAREKSSDSTNSSTNTREMLHERTSRVRGDGDTVSIPNLFLLHANLSARFSGAVALDDDQRGSCQGVGSRLRCSETHGRVVINTSSEFVVALSSQSRPVSRWEHGKRREILICACTTMGTRYIPIVRTGSQILPR